jgi:hypothetical protein
LRFSVYKAELRGNSVAALRSTLYRKSAPGSGFAFGLSVEAAVAASAPVARTPSFKICFHSASVWTNFAPTRKAPSSAPLEAARAMPGREKKEGADAAAAIEARSEARRVVVVGGAASLASDGDEARTMAMARALALAGAEGAAAERRRRCARSCCWFGGHWGARVREEREEGVDVVVVVRPPHRPTKTHHCRGGYTNDQEEQQSRSTASVARQGCRGWRLKFVRSSCGGDGSRASGARFEARVDVARSRAPQNETRRPKESAPYARVNSKFINKDIPRAHL